MATRRIQILLLIVAVLLALNVVATVVDWVVDPREAQADIVAGKNWFTTNGADGRTVYLWQYVTSGSTGNNAKGMVIYYGQISADGKWIENK